MTVCVVWCTLRTHRPRPRRTRVELSILHVTILPRPKHGVVAGIKTRGRDTITSQVGSDLTTILWPAPSKISVVSCPSVQWRSQIERPPAQPGREYGTGGRRPRVGGLVVRQNDAYVVPPRLEQINQSIRWALSSIMFLFLHGSCSVP